MMLSVVNSIAACLVILYQSYRKVWHEKYTAPCACFRRQADEWVRWTHVTHKLLLGRSSFLSQRTDKSTPEQV